MRRTRPVLDQFVHDSTLRLVRTLDADTMHDAVAHWLWLHEYFHRQGPAPIPEYLEMKTHRPLAGLEECRVDMRAIVAINDCQAIPRDKVAAITEVILSERLLRYGVDGIPVPNYDAIGAQVLGNYLRRHGYMAIEDDQLRLRPDYLEGLRNFVHAIESIEAGVATLPMKEVQAQLLAFVNAHMNIPYGNKLYQHDPFYLKIRAALDALYAAQAAPAAPATLPPSPYPALEPGFAVFEMLPEPQGLGDAMAWLEERVEESKLSPRAGFALNLCLDEAVANVLMHGFAHLSSPGEGGKAHEAPRIRLAYRCDGQVAELVLQDNGMPFDSTTYVASELPRTLQEAELGGHGIRLMRNYLSQMRYRREGNWNVLTLAVDANATA